MKRFLLIENAAIQEDTLELNSLSALVIGYDRLDLISLDTFSASAVGNESRVQGTELNTLGVCAVGVESLTQSQSLDSFAVLIIGQETI